MTRTLKDAQQYLRHHFDKGQSVDCPCCGQRVKLYKRPLNSGIALSLISYWQVAGRAWCQYRDTAAAAHRDFSIARFWGLLEAATKRTYAENAKGVWRLTDLGVDFVVNRATVAKRVHTFNDRVLGFSGDQVGIRDALGQKFDYEELMST